MKTICYSPFLPQSFFKVLFIEFSIKRTQEINPRPPFLSSQGHGSFVTSRNLMSYPCVCVLPVHNISYFSHLLLNFFFSFQLSGFHPFCFCLCFVPHSGAIMFASAYFRREGFDTGSCDCPGAPGAGTPKAAATSPLVCCVKTSGTFWVTLAKQKDLKTLLPMQCIQTHRALF